MKDSTCNLSKHNMEIVSFSFSYVEGIQEPIWDKNQSSFLEENRYNDFVYLAS